MTDGAVSCASCKKPNLAEARYCTNCGTILKPVFCSACGTKNPDGLESCLTCGQHIPTLSSISWSPIVTIIQPTSAMANPEAVQAVGHIVDITEADVSPTGILGRFRKAFDDRKSNSD